jgi:hypothetical protein
MMTDRLEIILLHTKAETFVRFMDAASLLSFLNRTGRAGNYQIVLRKGKRATFIEKIEGPVELAKELNDFQNS